MGSKNYINSSKTLSKSICLITPSHVSLNPRLVKEADALSEAGFNVTVFACDFLDWAKKLDKSILDKTNWDYKIITWDKNTSFSLFWLSRIRQHICKKILIFLFYLGPSRYYKKLLFRAYDRVLPEFQDLVNRYKADLYIAHNLQSLPIAVDCALNHNAKVGFDAEDFHSGMFNNKGFQSLEQKITNYYEEVYMPKCDYITASSQGIANAYVNKYCIHKPVTILNVFPLSHRPQKINFYNKCEVLTLYWFSQTIGADRGLEDVINAMSIIRNCRIVLHLRGNWQSGYKEKLFKFAQIKHVPHDRIICHKPESPDKMLDLASEYDIGLALEQPISTNRNICDIYISFSRECNYCYKYRWAEENNG